MWRMSKATLSSSAPAMAGKSGLLELVPFWTNAKSETSPNPVLHAEEALDLMGQGQVPVEGEPPCNTPPEEAKTAVAQWPIDAGNTRAPHDRMYARPSKAERRPLKVEP